MSGYDSAQQYQKRRYSLAIPATLEAVTRIDGRLTTAVASVDSPRAAGAVLEERPLAVQWDIVAAIVRSLPVDRCEY